MDIQRKQFLDRAAQQAEQAGHIYPTMAACEAALECGYGTSKLAIVDNNLFGMKQHTHPIYGTHTLPTREFLNGEWVTVNADWVTYPGWAECFADRMATLQRLSKGQGFPRYLAALMARTAEEYVIAVSATWSTDPNRAVKVLAIHQEYIGV